ncbi:MAG: peptidoglycan bridge formation glycyltransferase FemA/FemB family protein, partial [Synergistaceae bacterium]|nr:peptidoglycan bridge formation glycyltransferase FemA/FemB family protein [Synergistaceae bacterium]
MEIRELRMNYGTQFRKLRKSPLDHLSPDTVIVSLEESEDEIFARMRQTTRNSIRRSYRSGLEFRLEGAAGLASWFPLYSETAQRKNFFYEDLPYFESLFASASRFSPSTGEPPSFFVLNAVKDGEVL